MAFEEVKENIDDLKDQAKELLDSNIKYYKLLGFKIMMKASATILKGVLLAVLSLLILLFLSVSAALGIGYALDNFAYGFLIIAGVYLILAFIIFFFKDKLVEGSVLSNFSKSLLSKD